MSSVLTKTIFSLAAAVSNQNINIQNYQEIETMVKSDVFLLTYGVMCVYDLYNAMPEKHVRTTTKYAILNEDIPLKEYVLTKEHNVAITKEYNVVTLNVMRFLTNIIPPTTVIFAPKLATASLVSCIILDVVADALNVDMTLTNVYEINGEPFDVLNLDTQINLPNDIF